MIDGASYRQQFPALAHKTYLNFGGQGPLSQVVVQAIQKAYEYEQKEGPFCTTVNNWVQAQAKGVRETLATTLQTTPDRICLTESTTLGMNIPLWGLNWQAGDQILLSDAEHPGVLAILESLQARFQVETVLLPLMHAPDPVATIAAALTDRTRMVVISHVLWNTGRVLPLRPIADCCHQRGVLLHVDAAQSVGVLPLDMQAEGVDFYAFTGHKWLCGPAGVGALYISAQAHPHLLPTYVGWRSLACAGEARQFEVATTAWSLLVGWQTALDIHNQWGSPQQRYQQQLALSRLLTQSLRQLPQVTILSPDPPQSGLVSFTVAGQDPVGMEAQLAQRNILLRSLGDPYCLRASVHYFTTEAEIAHLTQTIADLIEESKP
ncbi:MAG: aminotransferase class V-fold PLP-dependent enzyme [Cyanobacteriota bacterium]|nr:aminotransferase class V-fold PLP-dependent enzyme [Cyanobacteriota bacterium]